MKNEELSIIMPVYNEKENIKAQIDGFAPQIKGINSVLYVVYDFEEDNTLPVLKKITGKYKFKIRLVKNKHGRGVLNAMKTGLEAAKGTAVLITMADNSDNPSDIPRMYELICGGYDVVSASRYARGGSNGNSTDMRLKKFFSWFVGTSLHRLAKIPTSDATNQFKMYRREALKGIKIESKGGFELAMELTIKAHEKGLKIAEIPTVWVDRAAGKSKFKLASWAPHYFKWYVYAILHR